MAAARAGQVARTLKRVLPAENLPQRDAKRVHIRRLGHTALGLMEVSKVWQDENAWGQGQCSIECVSVVTGACLSMLIQLAQARASHACQPMCCLRHRRTLQAAHTAPKRRCRDERAPLS
jgi:hypothetical protein